MHARVRYEAYLPFRAVKNNGLKECGMGNHRRACLNSLNSSSQSVFFICYVTKSSKSSSDSK